MDALLILAGLSLVLIAFLWSVLLAFATGPLWGLASLLPPLNLPFVLCHWRKARKAVVLAGLGLIPLVVGLAQLASHDMQRLEAILSLRWLAPDEQSEDGLAFALHGKFNGQPFQPRQGELIDAVLGLREGPQSLARRELHIRLPRDAGDAPLRLDVLPDDAGPQAQVSLTWLNEDEQPEAVRIDRGYSLHLELAPVEPNKLVGDFHLVLPPRYQTNLSGRVELLRNRLRYSDDGRVDILDDSPDTLAYVIEDYLRRRFAPRPVRLERLPALALPASPLDLSVRARVDGQPRSLRLALEKTPRGWRVSGDDFPPAAAEPRQAQVRPADSTAQEALAEPRADRRQRFSLQRLLSEPEAYRNLTMRLQSVRGALAEGRFAGLDEHGRLVIRRHLNGPGSASYALAPGEVQRIELLEP